MSFRMHIELEPHAGGALHGDVVVPTDPTGIVIFAHGTGSSRQSPRNRQVAAGLQDQGLATLLLDLLTEHEASSRSSRQLSFDIELLAARLEMAMDWVADESSVASLPVGLFGASTGSAAAMVAAANQPARVAAIVSRGGRADLASESLDKVRAPTLLIVGELDATVLDLNRRAAADLAAEHELFIVAGATHLFEEPGALTQVTELAARWFSLHLGPAGG